MEQELFALVMDRSEIDEDEFTDAELDILDMLAVGRCTPAYLADELDLSQEYVRARLGDLRRLGLVDQVHRGLYELSQNKK